MRNRITTLTSNGNAARNGHAHPSTAVSDGAGETKPAPEPEPKPPAQPTPNGERTATGQFAKGNKCSLGNPFARRLGALRAAFLDAVTDADVAAVARKLAQLAAAGDVQAAALYLQYAVGKPLAAVNPDRLDLDEFALLDDAPTRGRVAAVLLDGIPPAVAAGMVRVAQPADADAVKESMLQLQNRDLLAAEAEANARIGKPA